MKSTEAFVEASKKGGPAILAVVGQSGIDVVDASCRDRDDWSWTETLYYRHNGVQLYIFQHSQTWIRSSFGYEGLRVHWGTHVLILPSWGAAYADSEAPVLHSPGFLLAGEGQ